jgi:hypothetical protein
MGNKAKEVARFLRDRWGLGAQSLLEECGDTMTCRRWSGKALENLEEFRPKMLKELRDKGRLQAYLMDIQEQANSQYLGLIKAGLMEWEAEELILREVVLLPPEEGVIEEAPIDPMHETRKELLAAMAKLEEEAKG